VPLPQFPEQHWAPASHDAPVTPQATDGGAHAGGSPEQLPAQHSKPATHEAPSTRHGDVQTVRPVPSSLQLPLQQSACVEQISPTGRHGPAPGSQRPATSSHAPQHGAPPPDVQSSAVERQTATGSSAQWFPLPPPLPVATHSFEQQSASTVQTSPSREHSVPPQTPPWQANEQQSLARTHAAASGRHSARHARAVVPATGSHSPLQQSPASAHESPGPAHMPGGRQPPEPHRPEQQSGALPQGSPSARQAGGGAPSQTRAAPSVCN
jgi:hypothetical protein